MSALPSEIAGAHVSGGELPTRFVSLLVDSDVNDGLDSRVVLKVLYEAILVLDAGVWREQSGRGKGVKGPSQQLNYE